MPLRPSKQKKAIKVGEIIEILKDCDPNSIFLSMYIGSYSSNAFAFLKREYEENHPNEHVFLYHMTKEEIKDEEDYKFVISTSAGKKYYKAKS